MKNKIVKDSIILVIKYFKLATSNLDLRYCKLNYLVIKKMGCIINTDKRTVCSSVLAIEDNFQKELIQGHFSSLIYKKQTELWMYENAYSALNNKTSFNAEYIESLIYVLKSELKDLMKFI